MPVEKKKPDLSLGATRGKGQSPEHLTCGTNEPGKVLRSTQLCKIVALVFFRFGRWKDEGPKLTDPDDSLTAKAIWCSWVHQIGDTEQSASFQRKRASSGRPNGP